MWLLTIFAILGAFCSKDVILDRPAPDASVTIVRFITTRCEETGGTQLLEELAAAADQASVCVESKANNNSSMNSLENVCANYDVECGKPVLEKFKACLKHEEKDLLSAVERVANGVLGYMCEDMEHVQVLVAPESHVCLYNTSMEAGAMCTESMNEKFAAKTDENIFLKNSICSEIQLWTTCVREVIDVKCPELPELQTVMDNIFDIINEECIK